MINLIEIRKPDPPLKFRNPLVPLKKVETIVLHHMANKTAGIHEVHEYHRNKTIKNSNGKTTYWSGIGYNYFITFDGIIYDARGLNIGAHTTGWNDKSLGIGFQGDFEEQDMPDEQLQAGASLCKKLLMDYSITDKDITSHKDLQSTICPGRNFRFEELNELINSAVPISTNTDILYTVQVGAFKVLDHAEDLKTRLIQQGYNDVFIYNKAGS